nr:hypothetical protein [Tanacetum cinerariifolium]
MSTQQDIYAAGSENRPPMLNKDNYVPWSPLIIRYARSRPNGKMIIDFIKNGPYVRRMIATPGEPDLPVPVPESFHEQTDEELIENDLKRIDAGDQAIRTILLGLPEDVYAAVDSYETAKEIWERNGGNQNGLVVIPGIANQNGTGNVVAARAEGTGNGNQARCYNCRGLGHIARNYTARLRRRDAAYLQTQLLIAQKEEAGIQPQAEEFDFMAAAGDLDVIEKVNANCILMANLQHASTSGTQFDKVLVYDTDGSAEVQLIDNYYDNEIFNMFTQEEQHTNLLEPIPEPQLVPQNDNHVTYVAPSMVQSGGTVQTSFAPIEETRAHHETVYHNLVDQVAQNDEISNLNKQLSKEKSYISSLMEEKKKLKHDFKTQEDKFVDKEVDLEARIKDLENILLKRDQTIQTMHMLNPKPDSFYHPNQKMALGYPNPSYLKKAQLKQQSLYNKVVNYEREISHLKTTYKNLFDSITSNQVHAKLYNLIYENAQLRARVFENTSKSMKNTSATSVTPHIDKPKLSVVTPHSKKLHASILSHSVTQPREFNVMKRRNVIAPRMFKINPSQTSRVDLVPNKQSSASIRTNPITNSQHHVIVKENVSSNMVTASSTGLVHTDRTRRPQPKGKLINVRVPSASKSSEVKKNVTVV